ncbi:hypothetical protein C8F04DRAFT_1094711 [Mycena alexandri]|uniref:Apple domain-containing protein n=1 Tax=Mycena alexandri TaxID=1745969 RepID=A0AAD6T262_9AGAR|nr:hypothetical protein C8F04DRAFT_1094711 [Mycena alexandri]
MAIRTQLATLCILSCALLVAPSAYIDKKSSLGRRDGYDQGGGYNQNGGYDQGGGYNQNGGYDHNGGYDQNGGYDHNNGNGNGGGGNGHHGGRNASEVILGFDDPERFCADYLGFSEPYATTQTVTATEAVATITETVVSDIDLGTETDTSTIVEETDTVTQIVATTTDVSTTTSTETDLFTSTTTTYQYTAPAPPAARRRRAHAAARKRMQATQKRDMLPPGLRHFDDAEVSAACSDIAMPQTAYQTATTVIADQTETDTFTTTSFIGPTTTTTTLAVTTTTFPPDTETDLATTLTATTTSTTAFPTATLCAQSRSIAQIGIASDGGSVQIFNNLNADQCCLKCFGTFAIPNCGAWQYDSVLGACQIASGAQMGLETRSGCLLVGRYIVTDGGAFMGGDGPCSGGHY